MKRRTVEERLAALRDGDPAELRDALRSTTGRLIAAAAKQVAARRLDALVDELPPAFERLLEEPVKRDPGCRGKIAIVGALHELDRWEDRVFAAGLRHRQREGPSPGDDTGAELRALCGIAHAHFGRDDALDVLAALLADPEHVTRAAAARGLGDSGRLEATALLRFKLLVDDPEPDVLAACAESLLALHREPSIDFLIGLLAEHDDRAEAAALALGGARAERAFEPLRDWCIGAEAEQRHRVAYLAIALLRGEDGNAYLLDALAGNARPGALAAARALATFRDDAALAARIRAAAATHPDVAVRREIDALLG